MASSNHPSRELESNSNNPSESGFGLQVQPPSPTLSISSAFDIPIPAERLGNIPSPSPTPGPKTPPNKTTTSPNSQSQSTKIPGTVNSPTEASSYAREFKTKAKRKLEDLDFTVVGGGTGANGILGAFLELGKSTNFVIPISDNGGSSSEIIRVLGGPSLGDIRSRLVRLVPGGSPAALAIKALFEYRLPSGPDAKAIKGEWLEIVEGKHRVWKDIPGDRKEVVRSFLVQFEHSVLQRAHRSFDFRKGSVGNFFLSATRDFFRSIQSAIFLFSSITSIPENIRVTPVVNTNSVVTIAAEMSDKTQITGQCEISHPARPRVAPNPDSPIFSRSNLAVDNKDDHGITTPPSRAPGTPSPRPVFMGDDDPLGLTGDLGHDEVVEVNGDDVGGNVEFDKDEAEDHDDDDGRRIERIFYINQYGQEIHPKPNPHFISSLSKSSVLVYSCGSLFTSIIPCLSLLGVGQAISTSPTLRYKVFLLNTTFDRESPKGFEAIDFVRAVGKTLERCWSEEAVVDGGNGNGGVKDDLKLKEFITHLLYIPQGDVPINTKQLEDIGIACLPVAPAWDKKGRPIFDEENVKIALDRVIGGDEGL